MFVTWVLVGGLIGVLARLVMKRGGYRVRKDITLGLVGSICGSWIFRAMGIFPKAGNSRDGRPSPYREETLKFRCVSAKPINRS